MRFERLSPRVYHFRDLCNVYVVTSGERALLVDIGAASVLDHLADIGVSHVDWVLHTHHHRDQCQGDVRLNSAESKLAVPAREAHFFEHAELAWEHRKIYDRYDCTNVFDCLTQNVPVARRLEDYGRLDWEGLEFTAQPTPGHTKGSVTYLAEIDGLSYAFCGDLIHSSGRVWTLHDLHWDYSNPDALDAALHSVHVLRRKGPQRLAPSHGAVLSSPDEALASLEHNLRGLYQITGQRFLGDNTPPIAIDHRMHPVSENLIAITHSSANFYALRASDGRALLFDYGFPSFYHMSGAECRFVEHSLAELDELFGINKIDTIIPTHYHDDHVSGIPYLQSRFGTDLWACDRFADILEHPHAYRLPAVWHEPMQVTRSFSEGETVEWNGYRFEARHCLGHTWYGVALFGEIDGRRVAVTGDDIQLDGFGKLRGGGPVYRNGLRSDSFTSSVRTILEYEPEVLLTGHDGAIEVTRADLEAVYKWCKDLEESFRALAACPDEIEFALDPDFVSIYPYHATGSPGEPIELRVLVRNHHSHSAKGRVRLVAPEQWLAEPRQQTVNLAEGATARMPFVVTPPCDAEIGTRHVITADIQLGERDFGQATEGLITLDCRVADHPIGEVAVGA